MYDTHVAWTLLPLSSGQLYHSPEPPQLPGEYAAHAAKCVAQRAFNQTQFPSLPSQVPRLYSWVKRSNYGIKVSRSTTQLPRFAAIRTRVWCTKQLSYGTLVWITCRMRTYMYMYRYVLFFCQHYQSCTKVPIQNNNYKSLIRYHNTPSTIWHTTCICTCIPSTIWHTTCTCTCIHTCTMYPSAINWRSC